MKQKQYFLWVSIIIHNLFSLRKKAKSIRIQDFLVIYQFTCKKNAAAQNSNRSIVIVFYTD